MDRVIGIKYRHYYNEAKHIDSIISPSYSRASFLFQNLTSIQRFDLVFHNFLHLYNHPTLHSLLPRSLPFFFSTNTSHKSLCSSFSPFQLHNNVHGERARDSGLHGQAFWASREIRRFPFPFNFSSHCLSILPYYDFFQ